MRFPCLKVDLWRLRSGEERHHESPSTFWIPAHEARNNLALGQAVKLIFDIVGVDQNDEKIIVTERMWAMTSEIGNGYYIGILDNTPSTINNLEEFYLCLGVEVPFLPEHIIGITNPPPEIIKRRLSDPPKNIWPRN